MQARGRRCLTFRMRPNAGYHLLGEQADRSTRAVERQVAEHQLRYDVIDAGLLDLIAKEIGHRPRISDYAP
jgi:hypothetical protein